MKYEVHSTLEQSSFEAVEKIQKQRFQREGDLIFARDLHSGVILSG